MNASKNPKVLNVAEFLPETRILEVPEKRRYGKFLTFVFNLFPKLRPADPVRKIDVSKTTARVTLTLMLQVGKFAKLAEQNDEGAFDELLELMVLIFKPSFPEVTADWIRDNLTFEQIIGAFQYCIEPLKEQVTKNAAAAQMLKANLGR